VSEGKGLSGGVHGGPETEGKPVGRPVLGRVNLTDIDRSDELFYMSFEPDPGRLRSSIAQIGVLEPIRLRKKRQKYQILSGFRRFDVVSGLEKADIQAVIWGENEIEDLFAFQMGLHENVLTRGLNLVEKGLVLEKLLDHFFVSRDEVICTYLPLLNLESNEKVLRSVLLVNTFPTVMKRYALSHGLSLANVRRLARFNREEQELIYRLLASLRVGENVMREMLTFLREISHRNGVGIRGVVSDRRIGGILSGSRLSGPQKVQAVREVFRRRRYPRLSELEKRFSVWERSVKLSPHVAVVPPRFFEGDRFKIEIEFESIQGYKDILAQLQSLSKGQIQELLTIKGYG
jgi:ParB family chromosome partitioning protein